MKRWEDVLIPPDVAIEQAIAVLDRGGQQICIVTDEERRVLGTVTDGDIRRGILRAVPLTQPVSAIMNGAPITAPPDTGREKLVEMMTARGLHHILLVDTTERVVGMATLGSLVQKQPRKNWALLMAGGLGNRLRPLTEGTPKPLLSIGGRPLLETILESLAGQGIERFYISINYKAQMIRDHFGDGERWGVEVRYLEEPEPLGTAGPLGLLPEPPEEPLLVMNGDLLTNVNIGQLLEFHAARRAAATMGVREYDFEIPFGVVSLEDDVIVGIDEKPVQRVFVNAGVYALAPEVLDHVNGIEPLDMPALFQRIIGHGMATAAFPIHEYWLDIGRFDDLERANTDFAGLFQRPAGLAD